MPESYPENPITIGDHLKKRRMDLRLFQKDLAKILRVTEESIANWEKNRGFPQIHFIPNIIKFLEYMPFEFDTSKLSGKLKSYRVENGLSQRQLGKILDVDGATISSWETEECLPQSQVLGKLEVLLNTSLHFPKKRAKLQPVSCPETPLTLGDHIRKKRIELNLFQNEVANIIKVSTDNICAWETNTNNPQLSHFPQIIKFLGYFPFGIDTSTIGGRLKVYRYRKGLTYRKIGDIFNVSKQTVAAWEKNKTAPKRSILQKLERLLAQKPEN